MTIYMFIGMIAGTALGLLVAHPAMNLPVLHLRLYRMKKDMLKVGYGAMVLESLLAVLALCVAGAAAAADGTPAAGTPFQVFSSGVAGFFEMFGIPVYIAQCFMTMCVSALALTSLDAVARIGYANIWPLFGSANQLLSALVERTIGLVKAYAAGSATFRVEGLQLIIAILLMALGLNYCHQFAESLL